MYKYSSINPWHQDETAYQVFSDIDIAILRQFKFGSICEIGCGLGYFADRMRRELIFKSGKSGRVTGIDISGEAVNKAIKLFPKINFIKRDLVEKKVLRGKRFDLVVAKEILWYVTDNLPIFLSHSLDLVKPGGLFYFSQSFPESKDWIGKNVVDCPEKLKTILSVYAKPVYYCVEYDWNFHGRPLVHFLGRNKK